MKKRLLILLLISLFALSPIVKAEDDTEEWTKHLDVYNGDGLDNPVNAVEYEKTMKELNKLKDKHKKKKKLKKGEMPDEPLTRNEPVKVNKDDIIKITKPLYYDGIVVPVGFYKVVTEDVNGDYYINLVQGKSPVVKVKANKVTYMSFAPDKVNYLNTEIYQGKYYKINFKNIDYALTGYLAIME